MSPNSTAIPPVRPKPEPITRVNPSRHKEQEEAAEDQWDRSGREEKPRPRREGENAEGEGESAAQKTPGSPGEGDQRRGKKLDLLV